MYMYMQVIKINLSKLDQVNLNLTNQHDNTEMTQIESGSGSQGMLIGIRYQIVDIPGYTHIIVKASNISVKF